MNRLYRKVLLVALCASFGACGGAPPPKELPETTRAPGYVIGPLDQLQIFVADLPELSITVPVRPDGRFSTPLVKDMAAAGKTPSQLAADLEEALRPYVQQPDVSVVVQRFADTSAYTVRVMGAVKDPSPVPYRPNMTVLDALIAVGGLDEFAAGNRAVLIRGHQDGREETYQLRLEDLLTDADLSANAPVVPGDVIIVPDSLL